MDIKLIDADQREDGLILLTLDVTDDNGVVTRTAHAMPHDTAEWRVAEYGLDPDLDFDVLVDVLLWEHHAHADVAHEDTLHQAPTVTHAREALLGAVAARKGPKKKAARLAKGDPEVAARTKLKGLFTIEPHVVAAKRDFVEMLRDEAAMKRVAEANARMATDAPPPPFADDRAAVFHEAIAMRRNSGAADTNDPA